MLPKSPKRSKLVIPVNQTDNRKLSSVKALLYLPKIFDNNGNAELIISNSAQLAITTVNEVFFGSGLIRLIRGVVYRPMEDVAMK